jgi:hypothetical protein
MMPQLPVPLLPAQLGRVIVICYGCAGSRTDPDGGPCRRCGGPGVDPNP